MARRHNFQNFSWFNDLYTRKLLDLDPPYQRRSVWNQAFKDYFVDTVLLGYPSPAIFLFEEITDDGRSVYHVVDGKQRLTTLFEFVADKFPAPEESKVARLRGQYFSKMDIKKDVWGYQFLVEYIPTNDESIIDAIFDRLNRNVAKLSPQELRHAKYDGAFMTASETLGLWMEAKLPKNFPRIAAQSRRQMKDVEFVGLLLLLIEEGPKGYSQSDLDKAYSDRDSDWEGNEEVVKKFHETILYVKTLLEAPGGEMLPNTRLRNQVDFYSLFGAICKLKDLGAIPKPEVAAPRLLKFIEELDDENMRSNRQDLADYYEAARSASSDRGSRETRIKVATAILQRD
jgi:hypothetical protein